MLQETYFKFDLHDLLATPEDGCLVLEHIFVNYGHVVKYDVVKQTAVDRKGVVYSVEPKESLNQLIKGWKEILAEAKADFISTNDEMDSFLQHHMHELLLSPCGAQMYHIKPLVPSNA